MQKAWHSHNIQNVKIVLLVLIFKRVIKMEVNLQEKDAVTVKSAYALTSRAEDGK